MDYALKKCPNGMYAEIKYDGERVQVHKQGDSFSYFSRSLKPVMPHKVSAERNLGRGSRDVQSGVSVSLREVRDRVCLV